MLFVEDDGGRSKTRFKGTPGDCVCRAITIATRGDYLTVYNALNESAKDERPSKGRRRSSARNGVSKDTIKRYLTELGWVWTPTMGIGSGCKVHLREEELPGGCLIVRVSRHLVAVMHGMIHDTHDPSRDGSRCVYGYCWASFDAVSLGSSPSNRPFL